MSAKGRPERELRPLGGQRSGEAASVGVQVQCMTVPAPAKLNLFLHVTGRRADGYHTLESLFVLIDLADTIELVDRDDEAVSRVADVPGVDERDDLAVRAAHALRDAAGVRRGVSIHATKRIPLGAGLGGGSSDAASVLLALNRLWSLRMSRDELLRIAASLGADVPFFVGGGAALARGIGEILTPMSVPTRWVALAMPDVQVSTATIFASTDLTRSTPSAKMNVFSEGYGHNDLEAVAVSRFPRVGLAVRALRQASPSARMTGSGGCAFATFAAQSDAQRAVAMLPPDMSGLVVRTLARHPLASFAA